MNKDKVTNYVAILMVVGGAVDTYLQSASGNIDWTHLGFAVLGAVVAYFTGKPNTPTK